MAAAGGRAGGQAQAQQQCLRLRCAAGGQARSTRAVPRLTVLARVGRDAGLIFDLRKELSAGLSAQTARGGEKGRYLLPTVEFVVQSDRSSTRRWALSVSLCRPALRAALKELRRQNGSILTADWALLSARGASFAPRTLPVSSRLERYGTGAKGKTSLPVCDMVCQHRHAPAHARARARGQRAREPHACTRGSHAAACPPHGRFAQRSSLWAPIIIVTLCGMAAGWRGWDGHPRRARRLHGAGTAAALPPACRAQPGRRARAARARRRRLSPLPTVYRGQRRAHARPHRAPCMRGFSRLGTSPRATHGGSVARRRGDPLDLKPPAAAALEGAGSQRGEGCNRV